MTSFMVSPASTKLSSAPKSLRPDEGSWWARHSRETGMQVITLEEDSTGVLNRIQLVLLDPLEDIGF